MITSGKTNEHFSKLGQLYYRFTSLRAILDQTEQEIEAILSDIRKGDENTNTETPQA